MEKEKDYYFVITIADKSTNEVFRTFCRGETELSRFVGNLEVHYTILNLENLGSNVVFNYKDFLKVEKNLEKGVTDGTGTTTDSKEGITGENITPTE